MPPKSQDHILEQLKDLTNRIGGLEVAIAVLQTQVGTLLQHKNPNGNITFRWTVERVFMPVAVAALTAAIISSLL